MGRMFDILKQAGAGRSHVVEGATVRQDCVVDWSLREVEEVPYIEVGDGKKIDASPQVMAVKHPPGPTGQPPHLVMGLGSQQSSIARLSTDEEVVAKPKQAGAAFSRGVQLTEPGPMGITFEAWPGAVSCRGLAPEIIAHHQPNHPISQQYAALLAKILECFPASAHRALLMCGASPHVGASTALLNLAVMAVDHGKRRLVVVDAQRMRPSLADRLGMTVTAGLQDAMAGTVALDQAVLKTSIIGMHLLPARQADQPPSSDAFAWMLGWLRARFDLILVDAPPWEEVPDTALLAPLCDATFLVVPRADTELDHRALAQQISKHGGRLRGLIHTQIEK